jgi:hypothetical protein
MRAVALRLPVERPLTGQQLAGRRLAGWQPVQPHSVRHHPPAQDPVAWDPAALSHQDLDPPPARTDLHQAPRRSSLVSCWCSVRRAAQEATSREGPASRRPPRGQAAPRAIRCRRFQTARPASARSPHHGRMRSLTAKGFRPRLWSADCHHAASGSPWRVFLRVTPRRVHR